MPLEPLEHSVLGAPQDQRDVSSSDGDLRVDSMSACCPRVVSDDRGVDVAPWMAVRRLHEPRQRLGMPMFWGLLARRRPGF